MRVDCVMTIPGRSATCADAVEVTAAATAQSNTRRLDI